MLTAVFLVFIIAKHRPCWVKRQARRHGWRRRQLAHAEQDLRCRFWRGRCADNVVRVQHAQNGAWCVAGVERLLLRRIDQTFISMLISDQTNEKRTEQHFTGDFLFLLLNRADLSLCLAGRDCDAQIFETVHFAVRPRVLCSISMSVP